MIYSLEPSAYLFWRFVHRVRFTCPLCRRVLLPEDVLIHACVPLPCHCGICCIEAVYRTNHPSSYTDGGKERFSQQRSLMARLNGRPRWKTGTPQVALCGWKWPPLPDWENDAPVFLNVAEQELRDPARCPPVQENADFDPVLAAMLCRRCLMSDHTALETVHC